MQILVFVVKVVLEKLLKLGFSQKKGIFFYHSSLFFIFDCNLLILVEVFLFHERYEGRLNFLRIESFPIDSADPWMVFDLLNTMESQSVLRFSLDEAIDEISSFKVPSLG